MLKKILLHGVIAGLIASVPMLFMAAGHDHHAPIALSMAIGYLSMLIAFSLVFVAIKRHRDADLGGVIRFWSAFGLGLAVAAVASAMYVLLWETFLAVTQVDFGGQYARILIEQQKAAGVSGEALAAFVAEMERFKAEYANPFYRLPMTFIEIFPVGVLVSLLSAAVLRNPRFLAVQRA